MLELAEKILPEVAKDIINVNINSDDEEIMEIIEDFTTPTAIDNLTK